MVQRAEQIPGLIRKAFHIATTGRPGPVVVDIPKDVTSPAEKFDYAYPERVRMRSYNPVTRGHSGQIRKAVQLLLSASRPIIYSGGGVILGNATSQLRNLARMLDYPVTNTLMGLGAFPGTDRQFVGMLGMHGTYEANMAMHHADLVIAIGARFDDRVTNTPSKFCPEAKIIHIDIDPTSISKTVRADIPITGPVDAVLNDMISQIEEMRRNGAGQPDKAAIHAWWSRIDAWREAHGIYTQPRYETNGPHIMPQDVIRQLWEVTRGEAFITSDVGQHQMFAAQYYLFDEPRRWINSGGLGTMGFGLPAAMGVKLAHPDADVACVTGEGSIQMCIQELSTCTHYGLPVKIVNLNNGYLGMVKQWQDMQYAGRYSHSAYADSLPDFVKLAEAYGHVGIRVERKEDLRGALEKAFAMKDRLVFLDIVVDPHEHVYPMHIAPNGSMRDMWLSKTEKS
jgi:acetolactate synthase-1/2/3 large subunit